MFKYKIFQPKTLVKINSTEQTFGRIAWKLQKAIFIAQNDTIFLDLV